MLLSMYIIVFIVRRTYNYKNEVPTCNALNILNYKKEQRFIFIKHPYKLLVLVPFVNKCSRNLDIGNLLLLYM